MKRRELLRLAAGGTAACALHGLAGPPAAVQAQVASRGLIGRKASPFFEELGGDRLRCVLCPHLCELEPGRRGRCRVRENREGQGYTLAYGNPCIVQAEPVERKPFFHVVPGSRSFSLATAGCNLECHFCEVWDTALVSPEDVHAFDMPPADIVEKALEARARSVAFTFGEPVAFFEYMLDVAEKARNAGLLSLMHSAGFINPEPLDRLCANIDAANIDLKSFDPEFYRRVCGGELEPVLQTLRRLRQAGVHLEITNILIPTMNDGPAPIRRMCDWIVKELGEDTPLHFSRFYPLYRLANLPPTPVSTLDAARDTARAAGLRFVYVAKAPGHVGENTFCPGCENAIISRIGFMVEELKVRDGRCQVCQQRIPGLWA